MAKKGNIPANFNDGTLAQNRSNKFEQIRKERGMQAEEIDELKKKYTDRASYFKNVSKYKKLLTSYGWQYVRSSDRKRKSWTKDLINYYCIGDALAIEFGENLPAVENISHKKIVYGIAESPELLDPGCIERSDIKLPSKIDNSIASIPITYKDSNNEDITEEIKVVNGVYSIIPDEYKVDFVDFIRRCYLHNDVVQTDDNKKLNESIDLEQLCIAGFYRFKWRWALTMQLDIPAQTYLNNFREILKDLRLTRHLRLPQEQEVTQKRFSITAVLNQRKQGQGRKLNGNLLEECRALTGEISN